MRISDWSSDVCSSDLKDVRGFSFFGASFIYVIFEEGTDLYWARSRVLENLNVASKNLPAGVAPALGPDASGVGWVYQYVLKSDRHSLDELRAMQDWYLRYQLKIGRASCREEWVSTCRSRWSPDT